MRSLAKIPSRICALSVLVVLASVEIQGQDTMALASLTVPQNRLISGCSLSPSDTTSLGGNRIRGGLWAGLPISSNPWRGNDPSTVAAIRERVVASPPPPDGPPLSRAELARFRLQLAEDVEEAYAAIYLDAGRNLVGVYAVRFKRAPGLGSRAAETSGASVRLARGDTVVVVS